ncbi:fibronectin type III domain-containing protein [Streptomyces geranii]|uniref:fibronectin type III domain-containing protein n=1 Tax=Streptomyces geranii TaxID=2058923 RepID=UPI001300AA7E|nr:PA14 domain-containing protein [Streptomyces geranii]
MNPARRTTATATAATALVLATTGALLGTATPAASAATTCNSPVYKRQFFANTGFSGTPKRTDCDAAVAENWGAKAPATGLPKDNFGVRWTVTRDFGSGGPFALTVAAQDGIRVYLDGKIKVDVWKNVTSTAKKTVNLTIPSGKHTLRVDYANFTGNANVNFTYTPRTSATVDKVKPLAPTGASATYDQAADKVTISWAKNKEMDLSGYRVYRQVKGGTGWHKISGVADLSGTSFTQWVGASGTTFLFEVRAVDKAGNESAGSADQTVTTVDRTPPTVTDLEVYQENALDGVFLSWLSGEGSLEYHLMRASSPDGPFTVLKSASNSALDETAPYGETSYYKVSATDTAGNTGYSSVVSFARPLAVPYLVNGVNRPEDGGGVDLTWWMSPLAPADFRVYRHDDTTGTQLVSCDPELIDTTYGLRHTYLCTDTTPVPNTDYSYWVTTVDALGRESKPSQSMGRFYTDATAPPLVTGFTATATEYGTVLDWDDNPAADLAEYHVVRLSTVDDGTQYTYVGRTEAGTTRIVDSANLQDGETHTYYVIAVDTSGNANDSSAEAMVSATVTEHDLRPTVETPADWLVSVSAQVADGAIGVDLTWTLSNSYHGTDITGYRVSRWNPATAAYEPLTADPVTGTSYTDATAAVGTTHFYWVTAVHADGTESAPGDAWVALAP